MATDSHRPLRVRLGGIAPWGLGAARDLAEGEGSLVRRAWPLVAAALVIWSFVLVIAGRSGVLPTLRTRALLTELDGKVAEREAENVRLREEIRQLKQDPRAIEKVAREELNFAREGEVVIVVPQPRGAAAAAGMSSQVSPSASAVRRPEALSAGLRKAP